MARSQRVAVGESAELTPADAERLRVMHEFLCVRGAGSPTLPAEWTAWSLTAVIPGDPPTKARHRTTEGGQTYKDPQDRAAEDRTREHLAAMVAPRGILRGNLGLVCVFYRRTRVGIDADNLAKHVCDAGNGTAWIDDSQITAILPVIEHDPANPRTILAVGPHWSSMVRALVPREDRPARKPAARTGGRGRTRGAAAPMGSCPGCGKAIAPVLEWCNTCRSDRRRAEHAAQRVATMDGLF